MKRTVLPSTGINAATQAALDLKATRADPLALGIPWTVDPRLAAAQGALTANRTAYYRVTGGGSITKIGLVVNTSSGNICVSVYANSGTGRAAMPGARVATTGTIACPATGYQEVSLGATVAVTSGDFWFSLGADNNTAQFTQATTGNATQGLTAWQDTAFPSPATAAATNGSGSGGLARYFMLIGVA